MAGDEPLNTDTRRFQSMTHAASGSAFYDFVYTKAPTIKWETITSVEPPKPEAELTRLISEMEELVTNNQDLAPQFREFLDKHTEYIDFDFDIGA